MTSAIAIAGQGATTRLHKESHQILDLVQLFQPITEVGIRSTPKLDAYLVLAGMRTWRATTAPVPLPLAFLLVLGALPFWEALRQRDGVQRAMAGFNAAVVGVLAAALYDPVWTSAIHSRADLGIAVAAFGLLIVGRLSPVLVVVLAAVAGGLLAR